MNKDLQRLLDSDCRTMADADMKALNFAVTLLDDSEAPLAIRAMARAILITAIQNHPGEYLASFAAIAVAKHCCDKNTKVGVLEAALDEEDHGSDQVHTLLADIAMQKGHPKTAAYHLRQARRLIEGDNN